MAFLLGYDLLYYKAMAMPHANRMISQRYFLANEPWCNLLVHEYL
jgi:hypothetical protein